MAAKASGLVLFFFLLRETVAVRRINIPKPDISIGLNLDHDTTTGTFGAAAPRVIWNTEEISIGGWFDLQGGIDSTLTAINRAPETYVWSEVKRMNKATAIALRGDINANEQDVIDLDLRVNANSLRNHAVGLRMLGSADLHSKSVALDTVMASTSIEEPFGMPGSIKINPLYDLQSKVPDATVGYSLRNTSIKLDARQRKFTLSQVFGKERRNQIVPILTAKAKNIKDGFNLSYSRHLGRGTNIDTVTTTWNPNDSIAVKWTDGNWVATVRAPLEGWFGYNGSGIKFSMKQSVGVSLY